MNKRVVAVLSLVLKEFDNIELAAMNNSLTGYGVIYPNNIAFEKAVEYEIVGETGRPLFEKEDLLGALSHTINKRIFSGKWAM